MKIAVIGAGAIGNLVAGYLRLKGEDVSLIGHGDAVKAIKERGLRISGVRGDFNVAIDASEKLTCKPGLAILATKTQDIDSAIKDNLAFLAGTTLLTTQNGVRADDMAAKYFPQKDIVSSIVMFAASHLEPGKVVHNFEGTWIIGSMFAGNDDKVKEVCGILNQAFAAVPADGIKGMKYLKIFVNSNNCIPAILGASMQEAFSDADISRISIAIWREGLEIARKAGIRLATLPDFPLERITKLSSMPLDEAAKIFSGIMGNLSKEPLYGSILQSIKRGKSSEIDYINGEFVRLAETCGSKAPLNERLVEMVHSVEKNSRFFSKAELLTRTRELMN
jgi:2-dehydropantoate 2-reductase